MSIKSLIVVLLIVLMLVSILSSLGMGLYYLLSDQGKTKRLVRALTIRISLSILLFLMLFVLFALGWITPHAL